VIHLLRVEGQVDRENSFKEVWRAELLSRLELLDQVTSEQASRTAAVRQRGWDATTFEKRSKLYQITRQHYVALLEQLLVDGKLPMLWNDLDPDLPADLTLGPTPPHPSQRAPRELRKHGSRRS
jgi:hypothetical protein